MFFAQSTLQANVYSYDLSHGFLQLYKYLLAIGPEACASIKMIDVTLHCTSISDGSRQRPGDPNSGEYLALIPWDPRLRTFRPSQLHFIKSGPVSNARDRFRRLAQKMLFVGRLGKINGLRREDVLFVARKASPPSTPMPRTPDFHWLWPQRHFSEPVRSLSRRTLSRWYYYPLRVPWDIAVTIITIFLPAALALDAFFQLILPSKALSIGRFAWKVARYTLCWCSAAYIIPALAACGFAILTLSSILICWGYAVPSLVGVIPMEPIFGFEPDGKAGWTQERTWLDADKAVEPCWDALESLMVVAMNFGMTLFGENMEGVGNGLDLLIGVFIGTGVAVRLWKVAWRYRDSIPLR
ncbi:hypothetical protein LTR62_001073 [Meristemomyces frigidus]|uniref:Uncharacterized protein n=1 Tax=Meristemomyces frigidus TaxID=1508187 RepID=A0AAN7YGH0_9PEZI|nr:hypothetical protein LTR62_001073 [Meristemomyces frigidus]